MERLSGEIRGDDERLGFLVASFEFPLFRELSCDLASVVAYCVVVCGIQTVRVRQDLLFRWVIDQGVLFQEHRHCAIAVVATAVVWPIHIKYGGIATCQKLGKG